MESNFDMIDYIITNQSTTLSFGYASIMAAGMFNKTWEFLEEQPAGRQEAVACMICSRSHWFKSKTKCQSDKAEKLIMERAEK